MNWSLLRSSALTKNLPIDQVVSHLETPLYRNAYALTFSAITTSGLSMVFWIMAARSYPAQVVGLDSAMISAIVFLTGVASLNLDVALIRFIPRAGRASAGFIRHAHWIGFLSSGALATVFAFGAGLWSPELQVLLQGPGPLVLFVSTTISSCLFMLQDAALTGMREAIWIALKNPLLTALKIVLLVVLAGFMTQFGILTAWAIPNLIAIPLAGLLIFKRLAPRHAASTHGEAETISPGSVTRYLTGNYIGYLFLQAYMGLLPLLVLHQVGSKASAYFYPAWVIMTSLQLVTSNMSTSLVVEAARDSSQIATYLRHALGHLLRLLLPIVVLIVGAAPLVLGIFGKAYAEESTLLLRLFAISIIPNIIWVLHIALLRVQQRVGWLIALQAGLALAVLGSSYFLLPIYGITGVGLAWLFCQSAAAAYLFFTRMLPLLRATRSDKRSAGLQEG